MALAGTSTPPFAGHLMPKPRSARTKMATPQDVTPAVPPLAGMAGEWRKSHLGLAHARTSPSFALVIPVSWAKTTQASVWRSLALRGPSSEPL